MIANQEALKAQERKCSPFTVRAYENYHSEAFLLQEKNSYLKFNPVPLRFWLKNNAMLHQTFICFCLNEAKRLCLSHSRQSQSMRAKAFGSVLVSATETALKPFERFMEWNACLLHMFERFT